MKIALSRILVPVDGSPQSLVAFKTASTLSKVFSSTLTAVHISEAGKKEEEIRAWLDQQKDHQDLDFTFLHRKGNVARELLNAATEIDTELIVMGTHGVSGFVEFWMGSNANKVMNSATCPVLTMREDKKPNEFRNILLPIDTSFESRQKVPYAIRFAEKFGSTIHVLGVSVTNDKDAEYKVNGYIRQTVESLNEHQIKHTIEHRLGGNITNMAIGYGKEINADLIVIMTEQELQLGSFFLGKFAQQMVNHSHIPVLSIPPREDLIVTEARL